MGVFMHELVDIHTRTIQWIAQQEPEIVIIEPAVESRIQNHTSVLKL